VTTHALQVGIVFFASVVHAPEGGEMVDSYCSGLLV
jgi:hypothetical protein